MSKDQKEDTVVDGKNRQQLSNVIAIELSIARIRRLITENGINFSVRKSLSEVKDCLNVSSLSDETKKYINDSFVSIKLPTDKCKLAHTSSFGGAELAVGSDLKELKEELNTLISRHLIRAGDDSVCALASTANYIVEQVIRYGTGVLKESGKKTLKCHHIANDGLVGIDVWPFLRSLECVKNEQKTYREYVENLKRKKEDKKSKKKNKDATPVPVPVPVPETVAELVVLASTVDAELEEAVESKTDKYSSNCFKHHVFNIARPIVKEEVKGDVSNDVRRFCSNIVFEFIQKYNKLIKLQIDHSCVKTIKSDVIVVINKMILSDSDTDSSNFYKYVDKRLELYSKHLLDNIAALKLKIANKQAVDAVPVSSPVVTEPSVPVVVA
jgi:hypothetical protein